MRAGPSPECERPAGALSLLYIVWGAALPPTGGGPGGAETPMPAPPSGPGPSPAPAAPASPGSGAAATALGPSSATPDVGHSLWIGRGGGAVLLLAGVILALGLYLFAQTFFSASSLVSQSQANSNLSSSYIASQLNSIFTSTGASMVVIGVAVLLVGPGRMLMYLQKSRHAVEYAGSSLLTVGRIFVAASVFVTAAFFTGFTTSASPSATGSSNLSYSHLSYVGWVGEVVVLLVIGAVVGFVGDMLSSGPRRVESQIPRTERFQRVATYVRIADIVMLAIGIIVIVLGVLGVVGIVGGGSSSGIPGSLKLVGDGVYLLVVWAILSAVAAMFHSFAYAPQPLVPRSESTGVTPQPSP